MTHKRLTKDQLVKLTAKLQAKLDINHFSNDGCDVVMTGRVNGKEVAILWEIIDGVHKVWKVITEQGDMVFTVA